MGPTSSGGIGILFIISVLFFVTALVGAGGTLLYEKILVKSIADKEVSLKREKEALGLSTIDDLRRLDSRFNQSAKLLATHVAPSAIFQFLSGKTLENVQFTSFDYHLQPNGSADLTLNGVADSFASVALQSDQFNAANKVLKDVIFSNVNTDQTAKVVFSVKAMVAPALFLYGNAVVPGGVDVASPTASTSPQQ